MHLRRLRRLLRASAASSTPGRRTPSSTSISPRTSCFPSTCRRSERSALGQGAHRGGAPARLLLFARLLRRPSCSSAIKRIRRRKTPYVTPPDADADGVPGGAAVPACPISSCRGWATPGVFDARDLARPSPTTCFPISQLRYGAPSASSWPGRCSSGTSSTGSRCRWWLVIGCIQTFVIIPLIVRRWGKGAYCGWICSLRRAGRDAGRHAAAEDAARPALESAQLRRSGDPGRLLLAVRRAHRHLVLARIPRSATRLRTLYDTTLLQPTRFYDYYHVVDIFLAGVVGVGLYFWFSGRVWCRFACPLAALMHIYARFSRFRIFAEKKKCISCNVCTSVCHQGIDVMSFANKGLPMEDPECVRCSACVQSCPTGTLSSAASAATASRSRHARRLAGADGRRRTARSGCA